jgi:hypothetical protein
MSKGPRPKGASDSVSHPFQSLRHRNFRLFISGQLVSMVGTWIQLFAQSWLVYRITGSATALGFIAFASQAPILLLSSVTGVIVERLDMNPPPQNFEDLTKFQIAFSSTHRSTNFAVHYPKGNWQM